MAWSTTSDIRAFADRASAFLRTDPVAHTALLTEVEHLLRHPEPASDQFHGWWSDAAGGVTGAFVQAPRHPPLLSRVPDDALLALPSTLAGTTRIGVDEMDVNRALRAWPEDTREVVRIGVHRLEREPPPPAAEGGARLATTDDRDLLSAWFARFKEMHPEDASDRTFVVDDPLADGGIVLWETAGAPVAMSTRTPVVAGMTRMGLVFSPSGDPVVEEAALAVGCAHAWAAADDVLAFAGIDDDHQRATLRALGFVRVGGRALLSYAPPDPV